MGEVKVDVVWLSYEDGVPNRDYWDHAMLNDIFGGKVWKPVGGFQFRDCDSFEGVQGKGAVVVLPSSAQGKYVKRLNKDLAKLEWVVLLYTSDEMGVFPVERVVHDNMKVWVMYAGGLPVGYPPHIRIVGDGSIVHGDERGKDWFFSGQVNCERREECVKVLEGMLVKNKRRSEVRVSGGFGQGLGHHGYYQRLANSKVVPCPGGRHSSDTFRLYEALECGCVPVVDDVKYFEKMFGESVPFTGVTDYVRLEGCISEALRGWRSKSNGVYAWWQKYKRKLVYQIHEDIRGLSGLSGLKGSGGDIGDSITVLMSTSPIQSNPSLKIIEETIESIREKLGESVEILVMVDGVDSEDRDYEVYVQRLLWKCNWEWKNVLPILFETRSQQAVMTERVLEYVETPLLLFVEHDAPLCGDVEWDKLVCVCMSGEANVVRFHHESEVLGVHEYLMLDHKDVMVGGVSMRRCGQWSQRPHLASVAFYRDMLEKFFREGERVFIEDRMHGVVQVAMERDGVMGWYYFRLWMYCPRSTKSIQRSYHLDGRKTK